jgi:hypothetical protein
MGYANCGGWLHGEGMNNAFNDTYNNAFSPYSNPYTHTWSGSSTSFAMDINSMSGSTVNASFYTSSGTAGKPFKVQNLVFTTAVQNHPTFTWDFNSETDIASYKVYRAEGSGSFGLLATVSGTTNSYVDYDVTLDKPIYTLFKYYVIAADNSSKVSLPSNQISTYGIMSAEKEIADLSSPSEITEYDLCINYPNPFNPSTQIDYIVKQPGHVSLKVYDIIGNEVASLVDEVQKEGNHSVTFNAGNLASGVYLYTLIVNDYMAVRKMSLIK